MQVRITPNLLVFDILTVVRVEPTENREPQALTITQALRRSTKSHYWLTSKGKVPYQTDSSRNRVLVIFQGPLYLAVGGIELATTLTSFDS